MSNDQQATGIAAFILIGCCFVISLVSALAACTVWLAPGPNATELVIQHLFELSAIFALLAIAGKGLI